VNQANEIRQICVERVFIYYVVGLGELTVALAETLAINFRVSVLVHAV